MTVGEKIQNYRKSLGLSQEELGQKLLVSRQTVSLWENGQTVPTIDNLIRLKEIFNVSVDDVLGVSVETEKEINIPKEIYKFKYSQNELKGMAREAAKPLYFKLALMIALFSFAAVCLNMLSDSNIVVGLVIGMMVLGVILSIVNIIKFHSSWKITIPQMIQNVYEHKIFDDYIVVNRYYGEEKNREFKFKFEDIKNMSETKEFIVATVSNLVFIIRKSDLDENSFYNLILKNKSTGDSAKVENKMYKTASVMLVTASVVAFFIGMLSAPNEAFKSFSDVTSSILVMLFSVITSICSIIFFFIMKSKGYKFKINAVVGAVLLVVMCVYGAVSLVCFNYTDKLLDDNELIVRTEEFIGIDIPEFESAETIDEYNAGQPYSRYYIYYISKIYFENESAEEFEETLNKNWIDSIPNELFCISSLQSDYESWDYCLMYNIDSGEFNSLPNKSGKYRFMNLLYSVSEERLTIVEYDIEYTE